jgi:transposase
MPKKQQYKVKLTNAQRKELQDLVNKGAAKAREIKHANVLLLSDQGKIDKEILEVVKLSHQTVYTIRRKFFTENMKAALVDKPRPGMKSILDDKAEAFLISLTCSNPEGEREVWTMQMLADKLIELKVVDSVSDETVRRHLKKIGLSLGKRSNGVLAK